MPTTVNFLIKESSLPESIWNSRKSFRIAFETHALVRRRGEKKARGKNKNTAEGKIIDLSVGGVGLETDDSIKTGAGLTLFIDRRLFSGEGDRTKAHYTHIHAVVKTCVKAQAKRYRWGLEFEKISAADKALIDAFVKTVDRRKHPRITFPA